MASQISIPITKADEIVSKFGSREPEKIAQQNGILIQTVEWEEQRGAISKFSANPSSLLRKDCTRLHDPLSLHMSLVIIFCTEKSHPAWWLS